MTHPDSSAPKPPGPTRAMKAGLTAAGLGAALLAKSKGLLVLLKGAKLGGLLLTFGSMFAMVLFEAQRSGWRFGLAFVLAILVHELGHAWAIRREGLAAGYPVFIPFLGAMIALRGQPRSSLVEARIAIAGPMAGTAAALALTTIFLLTEDRLYLAVAYSSFFLNLFNMVPVSPLDGGRVAQLFSSKIWLLGVGLMLGLFLMSPSPQLLIIGVMAASHAYRRRAGGGAPPPDEAMVTPADRTRMAINYFGLCVFLTIGMLLSARLLGRDS